MSEQSAMDALTQAASNQISVEQIYPDKWEQSGMGPYRALWKRISVIQERGSKPKWRRGQTRPEQLQGPRRRPYLAYQLQSKREFG